MRFKTFLVPKALDSSRFDEETMNQSFSHLTRFGFRPMVDGLAELSELIRDNGPDRYRVVDIGANPFRTGHTSRRWGVVDRKCGAVHAFTPDDDERIVHSAGLATRLFCFAARLYAPW
jgi:hypothetical protein